MIRARFFCQGSSESPRADAPSVDVEIRAPSNVTLKARDGSVNTTSITTDSFDRIQYAAAKLDFRQLGSSIGRGESWLALGNDESETRVRYSGTPGSIDPDEWDDMHPAVRPLIVAVANAGRYAQGSTREFADGLPTLLDLTGLLLRVQLGPCHPRSGNDEWIAFYESGKIERWSMIDKGRAGTSVRIKTAIPAHVRNLVAEAKPLLTFARPTMEGSHDPTSSLTLVAYEGGSVRSQSFLWGRASRNDAVLEPVIGKENQERFDAWLNSFEELVHGPLAPAVTNTRMPPTRDEAAIHAMRSPTQRWWSKMHARLFGSEPSPSKPPSLEPAMKLPPGSIEDPVHSLYAARKISKPQKGAPFPFDVHPPKALTNLPLLFEFPALRRLQGVDCSTSRCLANAFGTGRIVKTDLSACVEFYCPDCRTYMHAWTPAVALLLTELAASPPSEHERIVNRWLAPRVGRNHPLRD